MLTVVCNHSFPREAPISIRFVALETDVVAAQRRGAPDANGQIPELNSATSAGLPCRHCLELIAVGEPYLILAHRPFPAAQPYAEIGPIFLHSEACVRGGGTAAIPPFLASPSYIVRGYGKNDRIVYGTGKVVPTGEIPQAAGRLLDDPEIAYVHVRSASNNCYHCRIERD